MSQVYVPDPASVGQHMADVAGEMARRGWRVVVLTANRGYDDPRVKYPARETLDGVEVVRLPLSSFGKSSIPLRLLGGVLFVVQAIIHGLLTRRLSHILISTTPPLCPIAALTIRLLRRTPITYWVMDLNPDQVVALGKARPEALSVRLFDRMNKMILARSKHVIALDRYMAQRLIKKHDISDQLTVMPPWPHDDHLESVGHDQNPFRGEQGWDGKVVVMFSGNLSIASPVDTILDAALEMRDREEILFAFIGGGLGKKRVEEVIRDQQPKNIVSLPYQPLSQLRYSLSAADVHLVSMGEAIVGICHPCKVYGAMAVARPILLLGPDPCHVTDLLEQNRIGWHIPHGDVEAAKQAINQILDTPRDELRQMGSRAAEAVRQGLSKDLLCGRFCDIIENEGLDRSPADQPVQAQRD